MTLDEAIIHAEWVAAQNSDLAERVYHTDEGVYLKEETKCRECAEEHTQLAEWLKELKALREQKRPRGKWTEEFDESANPFFQRRWRCSACNDYNYYGRADFCPCCGADMREGECE